MRKSKIGILLFSPRTGSPKIAGSNKRFVEEITAAGYEADIFYYDLFSVFFEQNKIEIFYNNKKFQKDDYLFILAQYQFIDSNFTNNMFIVDCLDKFGLKVLNPLSGAILAKNKRESLLKLALAGLPIIPTGINFSSFFLDEHLRRHAGKRIVVKANIGAMGYGVGIVESEISFISFMEFFGKEGYPVNVLIQPFINAGSEDYRVFVAGGKVITAMKRKARGIEFRANVSKGGEGTKVKISKTMANLAIKAAKVIGLDYAGVDIIKNGNSLMIMEINTTPGLKIEKVTEINVAKEIIKYGILKSRR